MFCPGQTSQGEGPHLSLSDAVSRAARSAGARPVTAPNSLQGELEAPELQEAYTEQVPPPVGYTPPACMTSPAVNSGLLVPQSTNGPLASYLISFPRSLP